MYVTEGPAPCGLGTSRQYSFHAKVGSARSTRKSAVLIPREEPAPHACLVRPRPPAPPACALGGRRQLALSRPVSAARVRRRERAVPRGTVGLCLAVSSRLEGPILNERFFGMIDPPALDPERQCFV